MGCLDAVWCLGDAINEHRFSNEVVGILRELDAPTIQGNHEQVFFGPLGSRAGAAAGNDPALMQWLAGQPARREFTLDCARILLVHSTPWQPGGEYVCEGDPQFARFAATPADIVLYGHTHRPLVARAGAVLVINPGSAGEPRLLCGQWCVSCAVLDTSCRTAELIDVPV